MSDQLARVGGKPRRTKARANAFTARKRQRFLEALATTCNVRASAAAAGVDQTTVYTHRRRDERFAARWTEALETGCDRLEALLIEHGGGGEPLTHADPKRVGDAAPAFNFDRALKALQFHRGGNVSSRTVAAVTAPVVTREAAMAVLDKAIAAAERRIARGIIPDA